MKLRHIGGVAIIDVTGTIRFGPESERFRTDVLAAFDQGSKKILLNLAGLERLDSSELIYRLSLEHCDPRFVGIHKSPTLPGRLREKALDRTSGLASISVFRTSRL